MRYKYGRNIFIVLALMILLLGSDRIIKAADNEVQVFTVKDFTYTVTETALQNGYGKVSVSINSKLRASIKSITIPEEIVYNNLAYQVESIAESGFYNCPKLSNVTIPEGVSAISKNAFSKCPSLMCVSIPKSVVTIDRESFLESPSDAIISCQEGTVALKFAQGMGFSYNIIVNTEASEGNSNIQKKLIVVGDSRTYNMKNWVKTTVPTAFVAKSGQGYIWFVNEGIQSVNAIKNPGDTIVIWLGVNDYFANYLGGNSWSIYANEINYLARNTWSDCKVYVASVGYVDCTRMGSFYGTCIRSNVTSLANGNNIYGIRQFNWLLKDSLVDAVSWIDTNEVIGIKDTDFEVTPDNLWLTTPNGKKDGLHYGQSKTQEIYNLFVKETMQR
ncbi:MAG TPA: leucine-rich repeat domain-containing protein [Lachnospiraceae bacterium]|nr:leucine-rich repeat domain-containing protein [Lachnospiraceae bacterium]